tara:strand:- start:546 stop:800 length:255 start_codon:yes stop_codon:yes gene_type:complete
MFVSDCRLFSLKKGGVSILKILCPHEISSPNPKKNMIENIIIPKLFTEIMSFISKSFLIRKIEMDNKKIAVKYSIIPSSSTNKL